jgi:Restriction endonuclease XhoI
MNPKVSKAVAHYWRTRGRQTKSQVKRGATDQGARSAVTGGAHLDEFVKLVADVVSSAGISKDCIIRNSKLELPGFYRPTKEWDLLVIKDGKLLCALEVKSQVGPSFGNNFNNRTEEAMGSAMDLWTAYREGGLGDGPKSNSPVKVSEPHFEVFPEFKGASYAQRYELFCRRLVRERQYTAATFLMSEAISGAKGIYTEPAADLQFEQFSRSLAAHVSAYC